MQKKGLIVALLLGITVSAAAAILLTRKMSERYEDKAAGSNRGFEVEKNGMPANWQLYTAKTTGTGKFTIATDNTTYHTGIRSLKFEVASCSAKGGRFSPGIAQEYDATPGKYQLSYWVKNNGADYKAQIGGITATRGEPGPADMQKANTSDWTQHTLTYTLPAGMKRVRFEFNVLSAGTLWIDDVELTRMP